MNNLENLVKQYETENPGKKAYYSYRMGQIPDRPNPRFMDWMAELASRPTCGVEQRKFLDVLGLKGKFSKTNYAVTVGEDDDSLILGSDFYLLDVARNQKDYVDFEKVIKGK